VRITDGSHQKVLNLKVRSFLLAQMNKFLFSVLSSFMKINIDLRTTRPLQYGKALTKQGTYMGPTVLGPYCEGKGWSEQRTISYSKMKGVKRKEKFKQRHGKKRTGREGKDDWSEKQQKTKRRKK
jgi:hypothetical protein